jgi:cell division protein FtsB
MSPDDQIRRLHDEANHLREQAHLLEKQANAIRKAAAEQCEMCRQPLGERRSWWLGHIICHECRVRRATETLHLLEHHSVHLTPGMRKYSRQEREKWQSEFRQSADQLRAWLQGA